jgi:hypothetical protein
MCYEGESIVLMGKERRRYWRQRGRDSRRARTREVGRDDVDSGSTKTFALREKTTHR